MLSLFSRAADYVLVLDDSGLHFLLGVETFVLHGAVGFKWQVQVYSRCRPRFVPPPTCFDSIKFLETHSSLGDAELHMCTFGRADNSAVGG